MICPWAQHALRYHIRCSVIYSPRILPKSVLRRQWQMQPSSWLPDWQDWSKPGSLAPWPAAEVPPTLTPTLQRLSASAADGVEQIARLTRTSLKVLCCIPHHSQGAVLHPVLNAISSNPPRSDAATLLESLPARRVIHAAALASQPPLRRRLRSLCCAIGPRRRRSVSAGHGLG